MLDLGEINGMCGTSVIILEAVLMHELLAVIAAFKFIVEIFELIAVIEAGLNEGERVLHLLDRLVGDLDHLGEGALELLHYALNGSRIISALGSLVHIDSQAVDDPVHDPLIGG